MVDKDAILDKLTTEDMMAIVESLGGNGSRINYEGTEISSVLLPTVCHHGDSLKLYYYPDNKVFHCYTECAETFSVYSLVMKSLGISFYEALLYVVNTLGYHSLKSKIGFMETKRVNDWDILNKYTAFMIKKEPAVLKTYNNNIMNMFDELYYKGWIDEGITIETMKKYNIRLSIEKERIVIPHYNMDGQLVGIRGRALNQDDIDLGYKYMPLTIEKILYSHQTKNNLYGLDKNKEAIKRSKKVMLVEAEKSVMQCDTMYKDRNFTLGVSGSVVSNRQRDIIIGLGVSEVILAFDKEYHDEASTEKYFNKILNMAYKFVNYCTVYILFDKDNLTELKSSPTDYGKEVLEKLMESKYEIKGDRDNEI